VPPKASHMSKMLLYGPFGLPPRAGLTMGWLSTHKCTSIATQAVYHEMASASTQPKLAARLTLAVALSAEKTERASSPSEPVGEQRPGAPRCKCESRPDRL
jgi:hypothetical protein